MSKLCGQEKNDNRRKNVYSFYGTTLKQYGHTYDGLERVITIDLNLVWKSKSQKKEGIDDQLI